MATKPIAQNKRKSKVKKTCIKDGCNNPAKCVGLCNLHYTQKLKENYGVCEADGCEEKVRSKNSLYCEKHYYRIRRNGDLKLRVDKGYYKNCIYCGEETEKGHKFCDSRCSARHKRGNPVKRKCVVCGREFIPDNPGIDKNVCDSEDCNKCSVDGCESKARYKGFCVKHYERFLRHGDPLHKTFVDNSGQCKVSGCEAKVHSKGFCSKHYWRFNKYGNPETYKKKSNKGKICKVDGCNSPVVSVGYCAKHYTRWLKHGDPHVVKKRSGPIVKNPSGIRICSVDGCDKKHSAKGYCDYHYRRYEKYGDPKAGLEYGLECRYCGKQLNNKGLYCNNVCRYRYINNIPIETECLMCGNLFKTNGTKKLCSVQCVNRYNKKKRIDNGNKPVSYNTYAEKVGYAENITVGSNDELMVKCVYCGKVFAPSKNAILNRVFALEHIGYGEQNLYCSSKCKQACPTYNRRVHYKGKKYGGSREVPAAFRQMALADRDYTCERCGRQENGLHVHHVEGYTEQPMLSADLDNVMVVCKRCHIAIHKQPGCTTHDYQCQGRRAYG